MGQLFETDEDIYAARYAELVPRQSDEWLLKNRAWAQAYLDETTLRADMPVHMMLSPLRHVEARIGLAAIEAEIARRGIGG